MLKFRLLFVFLMSFTSIMAFERKDTLYGYFDNNNSKDFLIKSFSNNEFRIDIYLNGTSGIKKAATKLITPDFFSDEEYFKNVDIFSDLKGGISILGFCCGTWKTVETFYYQFNDKAQTWILDKTYQYSYTQDFQLEYEVEYPRKAISINGEEVKGLKIYSPEERKDYFRNLLPILLQKFSGDNQKKIYTTNLNNYPKYLINDMLESWPVSIDNLQQYNDLAYYMQQTKSEDINAQYILEEVIKKAPERVVAYFNIADTYWDLKKYDKAKQSYNTYISLMKKSGKEAKIPKRVFERVK